MLDRAGDATRDVQLRTDSCARLSNLVLSGDEARVYRGPGRAGFSAERIGQRSDQPEVLRASDAVSAGYDDVRALQINRPLYADPLDHPYDLVLRRDLHRNPDHLAGPLVLRRTDRHHTLPHRGHLRSMLRIYDRREDVPAEGRTNLIQHLPVHLLRPRFLVISDSQIRTVRGQPGPQMRRYPRRQVPSDRRGSEEHDLRTMFPYQLHDDPRVRQCGIGLQVLMIYQVHDVASVRDQLSRDISNSMPQYEGRHLRSQRSRQLPRLGQQFQGYLGQLALLLFRKDPHIAVRTHRPVLLQCTTFQRCQ